MAINQTQVRLALRQLVLLIPSLPTSRAYENMKFETPNPPALWIRETLMPAVERLTANKTLQLDGIMQYDVFDVTGTGTKRSEDLAQLIKQQFQPATSICTVGAQLTIVKSEALKGSDDGTWFMIPVRVTFKAFGTTP